jgi:RNA polymerase sigma factor (sigma-70 family)
VQLLEQLASGEPETWNQAFRCLYPVAVEAARTRLGDGLNGECEDVAMETLAEILEKGVQVSSEKELKPLTAAIARNKATDRLRRHLAEKRGGNKVQSLEELTEANAGELPAGPHTEFVDQLAIQELRALLAELSTEVKKEYRVVLRDHFLDQLSYNEIASKRKISVGSVGVYVQRGLSSLRNVIARRPKLQSEFLAMLSDAAVVKVLLPLVSAVQLGGWFMDMVRQGSLRFARPQPPDDELTDEQRLLFACEELPKSQVVSEQQQALLAERLKLKYPTQFQLWQQKQEEGRRKQKKFDLQHRRSILRNRIIALVVLLALLYGVVRFIFWLL